MIKDVQRILTTSASEDYIILFQYLHKWQNIIHLVFEYTSKEKLH